MSYRFFTPPPARSATGEAAEVYRQLRDEFLGPVPTFQVLSAVPELMSATWSLMREALLAGDGSRVDRELTATAVSQANRCRFCVHAHVMLLHALGEHDLAEAAARDEPPAAKADLVTWAQASRNPVTARWHHDGHAAELVGTVVAFHFINRMVSSLLAPDLLPAGLQRSSMVRNVGGRLYAKVAREHKPPRKPIEEAYAELFRTASNVDGLLSEKARAHIRAVVAAEDGIHPAHPADWAVDQVRDLPALDRVGARIALLAAFAPSAVSQGDVALWRLSHPADADLVRLVAYGAITATDHVATAANAALI
ncbi:MAG: carboxymuconolactone decarboxylase family protein [Hamadaea sp.]|uniref:carboxymuconolactone decarboxylase family protein n=1 Tax=Hamadaea sp. TaxID=2024425 RepID=UPI00180E0311|nr:carboxymuconolactone decarboxylase family protein [Hamadaea sp.]NUR71280.1 carboxymuconolactone decarboxylase family protein [Hamadaea sp.]NUT23154.1 carboxymuconolactone decarboxylase family protein [Hamadaea sp.]